MLLEKEYKGRSQWIQEFDILRNKKPTVASIFCHSVTQVQSEVSDYMLLVAFCLKKHLSVRITECLFPENKCETRDNPAFQTV